MKLTIALLVASIPFLAIGGEGLYHAGLSRHQTTVTCDQLAVEPPRTSWLKVTGCELGEDVAVGNGDGPIRALVLPVRRTGHSVSEPAVMVAVTRHPEALSIAQEVVGGGGKPDEEARTVMMLRIVTALDAARGLEGYVRRGLLSRSRTRRLLDSVDTILVPGAVVLDVNDRPRFALPGFLAATGVVLLLAGVARLLRPEKRELAGAPETLAAADAPPPVVAVSPARGIAGPRVSGVLLLNLQPLEGREAIERAPPLGPRDEVEAAIARAIAGMKFDAAGRGLAASDTGSVSIDLGPGPVAFTAVLEGRGPDVHRAMRAIVADTGWRLYQPKRGTFLEPADLDQT